MRRPFEAQLNQNANSLQLGRSLQSPGPVSPAVITYMSGQNQQNQQNQQKQDHPSYRYPQEYHQQIRSPSSGDYSHHPSMAQPPSYGGLQ
jgi:hypothetical protein